VVDRGWASLLGRTISKDVVVHDGKDKVMYFGDRYEDLEFYIHLDADPGTGGNYYDVDLPESLQDEVVDIVSNIIRTGTPVEPPVAPTPVSYCDWVEFVKDVTIPDGAVLEAGTMFIKTWRLMNRGSCTWTPDYSLVYNSGSPLGNTSEVSLPGYVSPGDTIDVSVNLTAPSTQGTYRGYWMLQNAVGTRFGSGDIADKAFYVDIRTSNSSYGSVTGKICYPSERIPPMTLYLQNIDNHRLTEIAIAEDQASFQVQLSPGNYLAYAWTLNFEISGGYTNPNHTLRTFEIIPGEVSEGIDICDWYGPPGTIPLPQPSRYGTISGKLSYPSERIPPLRVVAFDVYSDAYYWVDTMENQAYFEITNLVPGYYHVVAYAGINQLAGGYTDFAKCGLSPACPEDHTLVVIHVDPGMTSGGVDPADWYAPSDAYPPDPTR
jgi:hypothetical protein